MFWFILFVIFFFLWRSRKTTTQDTSNDSQSSYDQGFWDGWRAFGRKVQHDITNDAVSKESLQSYVDAGATGIIPTDKTSTEASTAPQPIRTKSVPQKTLDSSDLSYTVTPQSSSISPEDKERLALKNLNTMLYVASFLLVAAAAAFIASNTPEMVRLVLLWVVTGLFFGGGLLLHAKSQRLKPAAVSFVGTGLAILPFAGLALTILADVPGQTAWFITSIIGIVAYGTATVLLKQAVIAYLTMAFVLSLATATTSILQLPLVWGFVAVMIVALIAHFVATLWPKALPSEFSKPIEQTGQYVTPMALAASLFVFTQLSLVEYTLIFAISSLQYIIFWAQQRTYVNETIARILILVTLSLLGFTLGDGHVIFITSWQVALVSLNAIYSLIRVNPHDANNKGYESVWLTGSLTGLLVTIAGWVAADMTALGSTINLELILLIGGLAAFRLRQIDWAYVCLAASIALPFAIGGWITSLDWYEESYMWIFAIAAFIALWQLYEYIKRERSVAVQRFAAIAFQAYVIVATIAAIATYTVPLSLWMSLFAGLIAVGCIIFSYVCGRVEGEGVAVGYIALAISAIVWNTSDVHTWHSLIIVGVLYLVLLIGGLIHSLRNEAERTTWLLAIGQVVAAFFALGMAQVETRLVSMLLLLATAIGAAIRYMYVKQNNTLSYIFAYSTAAYLALAWVSSLYISQGWQVLVLGITAIVYWGLSYRASQPLITAIANMAILGAIITLFSWINAPTEWRTLLVGWTAASLYTIWYGGMLALKDTPRSWVHIISLWTVLGVTSLVCLSAEKGIALAACATLIGFAVSIGVHGYIMRRTLYFDIAAYVASFALQTAVLIQWPDTPITIYGHITAVTFLGVALWRRRYVQPRVVHYFLAAGSLTLGAAISAFTDNSIYQLIFLVEHIIVLIIGGLKQWQKVVWWGVGSTVAAILYFLRDYFFLWLAFLGIVLIAIVIWRLSVINKSKQS